MIPARIKFKKIYISETSRPNALECLKQFFDKPGDPSCVGVLNVYMAMCANEDFPELVHYYNRSLLTVPDGMPLVWYGRALGYKNIERTCGPDLLSDVLAVSAEQGFSHYFIGSTPETLDSMSKKIVIQFPDVPVLGTESPPFRPLADGEVQAMADNINRVKPHFVWVGMSAPKQEFLIRRLLPLVHCRTVCIGVGLAFSYLAGDVRKAPALIQRSGLEWAWRGAQQPGKMKPKKIYRLMSFLPCLIKAMIFKKPA